MSTSYTEGFNYDTLYGGSDTVHFSGNANIDFNEGVCNHIASTALGSKYWPMIYNPYINGTVKKEPTTGVFYLTANKDLSGNKLTFKSRPTSADGPSTPWSSFYGDSSNPTVGKPSKCEPQYFRSTDPHYNRSFWHAHTGTVTGSPKRALSNGQGGDLQRYIHTGEERFKSYYDISFPDDGTDMGAIEQASIRTGFQTDHHNSYAYQVHKHIDFPAGTFDSSKTDPVTPFHEGTGIYSSRMISVPNYARSGVHNHYQLPTGYSRDWNHNTTYWRNHTGTGNTMQHIATTAMIKVNTPLEDGEYVPIMFVNLFDPRYNTRPYAINVDDLPTKSTTSVDIASHIVSAIGAKPGEPQDDYLNNMAEIPQWYTLSRSPQGVARRGIHDAIVFLGKPASKNDKYEIVVYYAGCQCSSHRTTRGRGHSPAEHLTYNHFPPAVFKHYISMDENGIEGQKWTPLFFHHSSYTGRVPFWEYKAADNQRRWGAQATATAQVGGSVVFALGDGIQDYSHGNASYTQLATGSIKMQTSATDGDGYGINDKAGRYGCMFTYIATDKIDVADINFEAGWSPASGSTKTTLEVADHIGSVIYFPQKTLSYEAVGTGSEVTLMDGSSPDGVWETADKIIDGDRDQTTTVLKLGEDNALKIKLKVPTTDPTPEDSNLLKEVNISIKNITKKMMNPALRIKYAVYNASLTPHENISGNLSYEPYRNGGDIPNLVLKTKLDGTPLNYGDVKNSYIKIWAG